MYQKNPLLENVKRRLYRELSKQGKIVVPDLKSGLDKGSSLYKVTSNPLINTLVTPKIQADTLTKQAKKFGMPSRNQARKIISGNAKHDPYWDAEFLKSLKDTGTSPFEWMYQNSSQFPGAKELAKKAKSSYASRIRYHAKRHSGSLPQ